MNLRQPLLTHEHQPIEIKEVKANETVSTIFDRIPADVRKNSFFTFFTNKDIGQFLSVSKSSREACNDIRVVTITAREFDRINTLFDRTRRPDIADCFTQKVEYEKYKLVPLILPFVEKISRNQFYEVDWISIKKTLQELRGYLTESRKLLHAEQMQSCAIGAGGNSISIGCGVFASHFSNCWCLLGWVGCVGFGVIGASSCTNAMALAHQQNSNWKGYSKTINKLFIMVDKIEQFFGDNIQENAVIPPKPVSSGPGP